MTTTRSVSHLTKPLDFAKLDAMIRRAAPTIRRGVFDATGAGNA